MMRAREFLAVPVVVLAVVAALSAQAPAPQPTFEVASVKPNKTFGPDGEIMASGRQFNATNASLRNLIVVAYRMPGFLIVGNQSILDEHFDVVAKVPDAAGASPEWGAMIQRLLAERFSLKVHNESKERPVYALIAIGKLGPRLRPADVDCLAQIRTSGHASPPCVQPRMSAGRYIATGIPIEVLANILSPQSARPVVDHTGLMGFYDVDLAWNTDASANRNQSSDAPPIFTAVQEQLGLKLEPRNEPIDILVIDHVERPSEN